MPTTLEQMLQRNEMYSKTHKVPFVVGESKDDVPRVCIVTCSDPRVHPETFFNLGYGEAVVFRTIAGHPQSVAKDIVTLDAFLGGFEEVALIHHTNCGSTIFTDDAIRNALGSSTSLGAEELSKLSFGAVSTSIEDNVRADVEWLKRQEMVREGLASSIKGYLYDVHTGRVKSVE